VTARARVPIALSEGEEIELDPRTDHHLRVVLRLAAGATVELVDAAGRRWRGTLGPRPLVRVGEALGAAPATPAWRLEVWLPLLKGGKTDDLVRQLTELGAARVVPFVSSRSVARVPAESPKATRKLARWRDIAAEATRQCGRGDTPEVAAPGGLPEVGPGVVFWEDGGSSPRAALGATVNEHAEPPLRILTGPEGGLSEAEVRALQALGWRVASLGPRVLRAETAVVAAATLAVDVLGW